MWAIATFLRLSCVALVIVSDCRTGRQVLSRWTSKTIGLLFVNQIAGQVLAVADATIAAVESHLEAELHVVTRAGEAGEVDLRLSPTAFHRANIAARECLLTG